MEARVHKVLVWCGPAMLVVWLGAFLAIAGFIPPSDPRDTAEEIRDLYADGGDWLLFGLVLSMFGSALLVPYGVAISGQLKRIEGGRGLATTQMVSCALLSLEFITPIGVWMAAGYRYDDRSAEVTRAIHDIGWILFMTVIWSLFIQLICIGVAILIDRREDPILPRWLGYLNFWVALGIIPAGIVVFFKDGPFAWNGVFGIYVPIGVFTIWFLSMAITIHKNLNRQIAEGTEPA